MVWDKKSFSKFERKINAYIKNQESKGYENGIPDEAPIELELACKVPSYRRICKAILKNDIQLESLGYSREPCRLYTELKRVELRERGVIGSAVYQFDLDGGKHECI